MFHRVARSVTADAKTKILVERVDPAAETVGGRPRRADRVREADATIERLVGLDYAGFTGALLPAAEFLAGDARTRRKILAAARTRPVRADRGQAGELGRALGARVTGKAEILGPSSPTPATMVSSPPEQMCWPRGGAALRGARDDRGPCRAWFGSRREVDELVGSSRRQCATLSRPGSWRPRSRPLSRPSPGPTSVAPPRSRRRRRAEAFAGAAAALADLEATWGDAVALAGRLERARALAAGRGVQAERRAEVAALAAAIPPAEAMAATATTTATDATTHERSALEAERAAVDALEAARAADRVAAVSAGLAVGDPCPVCGRPLESLPDRHGAPELAAATTMLERSRAAAAEASAACRSAERAAADAQAALDLERDRLAQAEAALGRLEQDADSVERELTEELGADPPADLVGELERRSDQLKAAAAELADRQTASAEAETAVRTVDGLLAEARARLATERARLEAIPSADLETRAVAAGVVRAEAERPVRKRPAARSTKVSLADKPVPGPGGLDLVLRLSDDDEPADVAAAASDLATRLDAIGAAASAAVTDRREQGQRLLVEARAAVLEPIDGIDRLDDLGRSPVPSTQRMARPSAGPPSPPAGPRISRRRSSVRAELEAEIETLRERGARFKQLALELRQDRIVAFLQEEALTTLAAAGSVHLEELSSGRYRLEVADDEFFVIDTWNGEDRRSVKTLSGGESFLASLGLALALSEQVPSLATNARSRVTSLFLDEGFGTLDEETLQVVIGAVEVLGGDDRMVGVVTHVAELAERLPARIVVEKSPRGSRISRA